MDKPQQPQPNPAPLTDAEIKAAKKKREDIIKSKKIVKK